ncbi:MAG: VCBS repeat-containing protein [Pseudomonadota bacterium]
MRGIPFYAAVAVFSVTATSCDQRDEFVHRPVQVVAKDLLLSGVPAWSALTADLDGDGVEELVLAGHRGVERPGYCRLDGQAPCPWHPFLDHAADRHDCAAADIDADGDIDFYCTAGAVRGAGRGPNEAWLQVSPLRFEKSPDALGASEDSSRGRLAAFLDFNGDAWPDLVSTAWGPRSDGADNRSKLWLNREGRFKPTDATLPPSFGSRCLGIADVNRDGLEDIIGCAGQAGLLVLLNRNGSELEAVALGVAKDWYWDAQFLPGALDQPSLLVSTVGRRGDMFMEITQLNSALEAESRQRIPCRRNDFDDDREIYCGRVLLHDADGDGHTDILVSRHHGWRHEVVLADAPDLLIFGPHFREFSLLPATQHGAGERLIATEMGVLQINAGKSWPGSVSLLEFGETAPGSR